MRELNSNLIVTPSLLLIDDSIAIHRLAEVMLRLVGVSVEHAYSGKEGLALAVSRPTDLVLLDYQMPDMDGLAVLKTLKREPSLESIPVIMITASDDPQLITEAFASGASDFVRKPLIKSEFTARILSALKTQRLIRELEIAALTDPLTGLANRNGLSLQIAKSFDRTSDAKQSRAVLFFDLDRFKQINDSLGHGVGDQLIREVARRLGVELQCNPAILGRSSSSTLARVGGDEFLVFMEGVASAKDAKQISEHLINSLSQPYTFGSNFFYSTGSAGVAFSVDESLQSDDLVRLADIALNEAKKAGRSCSRLFDQGMRENCEHQFRLEAELRKAVLNKDFHLVYQPIIELASGRIDSVEALIRWDHPEHGVVSPAEFIPISEDTGLIKEIGDWCMETAFLQFADWKRNIPRDAPKSISVNIARQQLSQPNFSERVRAIAKSTGVSTQCVNLEITESELMVNLSVAIEALTNLRNQGFKIHVDDFGTGYSSLACLNQFPIDVLKLDRSIIADIASRRYPAKLVEFVLRLARETDVSVIAEGIETQQQLDLLTGWRCRFGQGFLIARPMIAESFAGFAHTWNGKHLAPIVMPRRTQSKLS